MHGSLPEATPPLTLGSQFTTARQHLPPEHTANDLKSSTLHIYATGTIEVSKGRIIGWTLKPDMYRLFHYNGQPVATDSHSEFLPLGLTPNAVVSRFGCPTEYFKRANGSISMRFHGNRAVGFVDGLATTYSAP